MGKLISIFSQNCFLQCDIDLVKELARDHSIQWVIVVPRDEKLSFEAEEIARRAGGQNVELTVYRLKSRMRYPQCAWEYFRLMLKLRKFGADVIYLNASGIPWLSFVSWLVLPVKKVIWAIHDVKEHSDRKWTTLYKKSIYFLFSAFHVLSKNQFEILKRIKPSAKIYYAPHAPISYGEVSGVALKSDKVRFLFFGNIASYKGLDVLVKAGQQLWDLGERGFEIVICGNGKHWQECSALIKSPEAFKLEIRYIENEEIPGIFTNSDWLMLPYNDVTQSGPMALSFHYQLPYITSNLPEFQEYSYSETECLTFKRGDPRDLCQVMRNILAMSLQRRESIRQEFIQMVQLKYSLNACAEKYTAMLTNHAGA